MFESKLFQRFSNCIYGYIRLATNLNHYVLPSAQWQIAFTPLRKRSTTSIL
jgi:hypothetical protein